MEIIKKQILEQEVNDIKSHVFLCYNGANSYLLCESVKQGVPLKDFKFVFKDLKTNPLVPINDKVFFENHEKTVRNIEKYNALKKIFENGLICTDGLIGIKNSLKEAIENHYTEFTKEIEKQPLFFNVLFWDDNKTDLFCNIISESAIKDMLKNPTEDYILIMRKLCNEATKVVKDYYEKEKDLSGKYWFPIEKNIVKNWIESAYKERDISTKNRKTTDELTL